MAQVKDHVYYIATDRKGKETHALLIKLNKQGHADLSQLPRELREELRTTGVRSRGFEGQLFPEHGIRFLSGLLRSVNGYTATYRVTVSAELIAAAKRLATLN